MKLTKRYAFASKFQPIHSFRCTYYEAKYLATAKKICPLCKEKMEKRTEEVLTGKVNYNTNIDKNGNEYYTFKVMMNAKKHIAKVNNIEEIPDNYQKSIFYDCEKCQKEYTLEYLTEQHFLEKGLTIEEIKSNKKSGNIEWIFAIILSCVFGVFGYLDKGIIGFLMTSLICITIFLSYKIKGKKVEL